MRRHDDRGGVVDCDGNTVSVDVDGLGGGSDDDLGFLLDPSTEGLIEPEHPGRNHTPEGAVTTLCVGDQRRPIIRPQVDGAFVACSVVCSVVVVGVVVCDDVAWFGGFRWAILAAHGLVSICSDHI